MLWEKKKQSELNESEPSTRNYYILFSVKWMLEKLLKLAVGKSQREGSQLLLFLDRLWSL